MYFNFTVNSIATTVLDAFKNLIFVLLVLLRCSPSLKHLLVNIRKFSDAPFVKLSHPKGSRQEFTIMRHAQQLKGNISGQSNVTYQWLPQLHYGQWNSLLFCLPSLIVQWPIKIFQFSQRTDCKTGLVVIITVRST